MSGGGSAVDRNLIHVEADETEDTSLVVPAVNIQPTLNSIPSVNYSEDEIPTHTEVEGEDATPMDAEMNEGIMYQAPLDSVLAGNYPNAEAYMTEDASPIDSEANTTEDATPTDAEEKVSQASLIHEGSFSTTKISEYVEELEKSIDGSSKPIGLFNKRSRIIMSICLVTFLIIIGIIALYFVFQQTSKLWADTALIQSTVEAIIASNDNTTRLAGSIQALESTAGTRNRIILNMLGELKNQLSNVVNSLERSRLELMSATATGLTDFEEIRLESDSNYISSQLSLAYQISDVGFASFAYQTQRAHIIDLLNSTRHVFLSCAAILQSSSSSPSGNYRIKSPNGYVNAYCDMFWSCGGITGGWMRVTELDISNPNTQCPSGLELITSPRRLCRGRDPNPETCSEDRFALNSFEYTKVCGRIIGYQFGNPKGFGSSDRDSELLIDLPFVDGVSLTHGENPRTSIWTFVAAANDDEKNSKYKCACSDPTMSSLVTPVPEFVLNNYFCDSVASTNPTPMFYLNEPLWNGAGCETPNVCCIFNNPPLFYRDLFQPSTDDIDMRVCRGDSRENVDILINIVELYVQ